MKNFIFLIPFLIFARVSFAQEEWATTFDPSSYQYVSYHFYTDSLLNPGCKWQIGHPGKSQFDSAFSNPNALVTDTLNTIPSADTSIIFIRHFRMVQPFHVFVLHFKFRMDGDPSDRGSIEISPDAGLNWINLLTQDSTYQCTWYSAKPSLFGSTNGWQTFDLNMMSWASGWGIFPINFTSDTVLFRLTYITGNHATLHDGWMIDDLQLEDWWEGIPELQNNQLISVFPNPAGDRIIIKSKANQGDASIQILNSDGILTYENLHFSGDPLDISHFVNGVYILRYSDGINFSIKKFIVRH